MRILVVGGGLAGLTCSYLLSKEGNDVVLVEETDQLGGALQTIRYSTSNKENYFFDLGPHITRMSDRHWNKLTKNAQKIITAIPEEKLKISNCSFTLPLNLKNISTKEVIFPCKVYTFFYLLKN